MLISNLPSLLQDSLLYNLEQYVQTPTNISLVSCQLHRISVTVM